MPIINISSFALSALLLASCASNNSVKEEPINQRIWFSGARSDLLAEHRQDTLEIGFENKPLTEGVHTTQFPLTYAVQCNTARTSCKYAVIKTEMIYTTRVTGERFVNISGVLKSEMGRSFTQIGAPSSEYSQTISMKVPPAADVIAELKEDRRFDRVLRLGEKLEIKGLGGVLVVLEFQ